MSTVLRVRAHVSALYSGTLRLSAVSQPMFIIYYYLLGIAILFFKLKCKDVPAVLEVN